MKLGEARKMGAQLRDAEARFDQAWRQQFAARMAVGAVIGLIPAMLLGRSAGVSFGLPLLLGSWGLWCCGLWWYLGTSATRLKQRFGAGSTDARVLERCARLPDIPAAVAEPLERALDSYRSISRSAEDPLWERGGFPARQAVERAGEHLIGLLDWGERLAGVGDSVARLRGAPDADELRGAYEAQLAQLTQAAAAFERTEARMARAHLALAGTGPVAPAELADLTAAFDAITEISRASPAFAPPTEAQVVTLSSG
jgi:hypothetical protein